MATITTLSRPDWTVADLFEHFGPIPFRRIRQVPGPGTATEQDVLAIRDRERRLFELVDGVLVEKAVGIQESYLAILIAGLLGDFAARGDLGMVLGADGMARLASGLVRIPDVSFISWDRLPGRRVPSTPFLDIAPDLAVEVLSPSNTAREMDRKLLEYFQAGVRLVWYVDPAARTVRVFSTPGEGLVLGEDQELDGSPVLTGLRIPLRPLFARLGPRPTP
ncbi:Endonuclease, Uma2 family (restriction endonuclease fold) [Singulisphaera sp. GP187]|uniref:Uma2 family endonuclease n=1 Tax=Singulisphaera sp. GP187 TaxID=1882752 RepID=UPI0009277FD7|nr:Uma2 family endonuclease [Singulisphaera sp. GP187]SIO42432.1 Endonuclease, Uma2 family (restriction endonuclease fold) [Singulisphaera sp. GP187]